MAIDTSLKVLVVEDSRSTRKMEVKALTVLGFSGVLEANDGKEATGLLEAGERPQIIISDWNMPEMNGYELLNWVRAHPDPAISSIRFIIATGRGEKENAVLAEKAGVSAMVTKPFSPPELAAVIEEAFSAKTEKPTEHPPFVPEKDSKGRVVFRIGHLQITDHIILGVLRSFIDEGKLVPKHFSLETCRETSWNPVQNKLEKAELGGAFMLAPIAMDLYQYGTPLQLVLFAHKNGSICVRRKPAEAEAGAPLADFLRNKTFYIPHSLSIHHMLAHKFLTQLGLKPGMQGSGEIDVMFEVAAPVMMPEFITDPSSAGFIVAEPLGTKAISAGSAELMFLTGEMWESHPCCVVVLRQELVDQYPAAVSEFVSMLLECGRFVEKRPDLAAFIGVSFLDPEGKLGLNTAILTNVLKEKGGISTLDLYPVAASLGTIRDYMRKNMNIDLNVDLNKFVNTTFADQAYATLGVKPRLTVGAMVEDAAGLVLRKTEAMQGDKSNLQYEGRYLFFALDGEEYGIHIMYVREIIKMRPLRTMPEAPSCFKGVINLRNKVIPVINLRTKLNMPEVEYGSGTCIIVVEQCVGGKIMEVGLIVDSVSEVTDINGANIQPKPNMIASPEILAYTEGKGRLRTLMAANLLLGSNDQQFIEQAVF